MKLLYAPSDRYPGKDSFFFTYQMGESQITDHFLSLQRPSNLSDWSSKTSLQVSSPFRSGGGAGKLKRESLQLPLWNLDIRIEKADAKCWLDGDEIRNDVIILGTCFSMFVFIRARFRFALIGGNLTAQSTGSHRGIEGYITYFIANSPKGLSRNNDYITLFIITT